uniref:Cyanobacterial aminoacyl-tRNA synthetase CAAD domain-containing protein n=1 Tax=Araucaria cunninghamii TaxID=56994 RepID=A0A0D6QRK5_ARACU
MATCSASTPISSLPSSSAKARTSASAHFGSISLPLRRLRALNKGPHRANSTFCTPKSGLVSLAVRARTSEETSTDVSELEISPVATTSEETSNDASEVEQLEVSPVATTSEETLNNVSEQLEVSPVAMTEKTPADLSGQLEALPERKEIPEESSSAALEEFDMIFSDLKKKFDDINNKSTIILYGSAAVVGLWVSGAIVDAIDSIPLFPKLMEFVGFGYTVWFVYRYLLFKKSREELSATIEEIKQKIIG